MNVILPDVGERHMLRVKNGVLLVYKNTLSDSADVSITCPKNALFAILTNNQGNRRQGRSNRGPHRAADADDGKHESVPDYRNQPFNIIEP